MISRRFLLGTLAALPMLPRLLSATVAQAQTDQTQSTSLASWNDGPAKRAILDFVRDYHGTGRAPKFVLARGSYRHVRPGRHAVGGAPGLRSDDVLPWIRCAGRWPS